MSPMVSHPLTMEHALLGFLRTRPMHGYELYQTLRSRGGLGSVWHMKQSQLYALLAKLEEHAFVVAQVEPQENRPARKMFSLTPEGLSAFQRWVSAPVTRPRDLRLEFLAKLFFSRRDGTKATQELIRVQERQCRRWLEDCRSRMDAADELQSYERAVWSLRAHQIEAMLVWLASCGSPL